MCLSDLKVVFSYIPLLIVILFLLILFNKYTCSPVVYLLTDVRDVPVQYRWNLHAAQYKKFDKSFTSNFLDQKRIIVVESRINDTIL